MSYMSKSETFRTEEMRMNNQLDRAAEKAYPPEIPEEEEIFEEIPEDIDEEPEEDDEREQMIEDRGIDADNFSLKNMPM